MIPFSPPPSRRPVCGVLALVLLLSAGCQTPPRPGPTADRLVADGIARAEQQDYDGAIADFNRALALRPGDADTRFNLGLARGSKQDYAGALAEFNRALALRPGDPEIWLSRGSVKFYQEDYAGAIADYDRAVAVRPDYALGYYARALAQRRRGNYDGAFADYDRAIALDPSSWLAYNGRATTRNGHGDFALALPDYARRIALRPEDAQYVWFERSLVLRRLGRPDEFDLAGEVAGWPDGWPKTVGRFLLGDLEAGVLLRLAAAPADAQTRREQLCEANYYVGMDALLDGRTAEAREKFLACRATGVDVFLEYFLAGVELARLGDGDRVGQVPKDR
jgi:tetratricopeptide (TPR) repeat protein